MIISPGRGYIFAHIPKTGGTSLALALEGRAMKEDILLGDTPKALKRRNRVKSATTKGRLWKHSTLGDVDGLLPASELASLFAFTMVRNPWDRAVSYYHWLSDQSFDHRSVALAQSLPFEEFVTHAHTRRSFAATPARFYMRRADGREHCQLYIRLEHFDSDAAPLWDHLGFELTLPHENRSERSADYRGYYSDASRKAVAQACAEDIDRFGYRFD